MLGHVNADALPAIAPVLGPIRRFSVAEYHRLIDAGVFEGDERVELLEGSIATKMTRKPPHDAAVAQLAELLRAVLPPTHHIRVQSAVTTADSEPEPDIAVVRGRALDYRERHPGPGDIALLVEVADSSVERDRAKARIYARAGVGAYWLVNLVDKWIEEYAEALRGRGDVALSQATGLRDRSGGPGGRRRGRDRSRRGARHLFGVRRRT